MHIRLSTLGEVDITVDGEAVQSLRQQPTRCGLLVYLAAERRVTRDIILDMFWPGSAADRGRNVLNQNLHRLRQALRREWITNSGGVLTVMEDVMIDVAELEEAVGRADFRRAADLYRGPFLHNFPLPQSAHFERWASIRRTRAAGLHRRARRGLVEAHLSRGQQPLALAEALAWSEADPLKDEAQHFAIELLHEEGRTDEALARFEEYRTRLRDELELDPMDDLLRLAERLRLEHERRPAPRPLGSSPAAAEPPVPSPPPAASPLHAARPRLRRGVGIGVLLIALVATLGWLYGRRAISPAADLDPNVVAVFGFEDVGTSGAESPLGPGLTDELVLRLSQIPSLSVVPVGGSRSGTADERDSLAHAAGAGLLVHGKVQHSGGRVRVIYHLAEAGRGRIIQSGRIERPVGELFELQDEVSGALLRALRQRLGRLAEERELAAARPVLEAYLLVQRADAWEDSLWHPGTRELRVRPRAALLTLAAADSLFARAEKLDPSWVEPTIRRGWNALERARLVGSVDRARYNGILLQALRHAEGAVQRAGGSARALELRGTIRMQAARINNLEPGSAVTLRSAEADLRRAIEIDPRLASALATLSRLELLEGDVDASAVLARRALHSDPFLRDGPDIAQRLFRAYLDAEQFRAAEDWCRRGREEFPSDWRFLECELAIAAWDPESRVRPDSAWSLVETLRGTARTDHLPRYQPYYREMLYARVLARAGLGDSARIVQRRIRREVASSADLSLAFAFDAAALHLVLGDTAGSLREVERYLEGNPQHREYVWNDFAFRGLRSHPRFQAIVQARRGPR
ncbi:BTAD domain-containing putative transcriptional regulator [Longimicrobium sp.]|uniref:BTAD domain-containing putative transcriptional regulator n=1 Tax=Longimicrobium sp. TaxID=2029185 RepID=UPI002F93612C